MVARLLVLFVLVASSAFAQVAKPVGVFDGGHNPPSWAAFATISDLDPPHVWAEAIALSRSRGTLWWLKLGYHENPTTPIGAHAARVRNRLDEYGLLPYVAGMSVGEEWYGYWSAGDLTRYGLPPGYPNGHRIIRDWLGYQHAEAKRHIPVPVIWISPVVTGWDGPLPIPLNTDAVALDPYIFPGGTFQSDVEPWLRLAEEVTPLPLVLIAQWFEAPGFEAPRAADVSRYLAWLSRPRWIALAGFTWQDRPTLAMRGLSSLPALRLAVESSLRGQ
jgi:hypothetical protein